MKANRSNKVDFIHVGVMRGASTWLEQALKEHPAIEIHKTRLFVDHQDMSQVPLKTCQSKLLGLVNEKLLNLPEVPKLIYQTFPQVKVIVVLRNPVSRLVSGYCLYKSNHITSKIDLEEFVKNYSKGKLNIQIGLYKKDVENYLQYIPRENMGFFLFDELKNDSRNFIASIYKYLGVNANFIPSMISQRINIGVHLDSNWVKKIPFIIKHSFLSGLFYRFIERFLKSETEKLIHHYKDFLDDHKSFYKNENKGLDELIGVDTSHWY